MDGQVGGKELGHCFLSHIHGAEQPVPILPASPRPAAEKTHSCFLVAGKLACSAADAGLSTRRARGRKFLKEISDAGAPEGHFPPRRPQRRRGWTGRSGRLKSGGQQPKTSQTWAGPGPPEPCDVRHWPPTAGRASGRPYRSKRSMPGRLSARRRDAADCTLNPIRGFPHRRQRLATTTTPQVPLGVDPHSEDGFPPDGQGTQGQQRTRNLGHDRLTKLGVGSRQAWAS
jgi:hypothetical protein